MKLSLRRLIVLVILCSYRTKALGFGSRGASRAVCIAGPSYGGSGGDLGEAPREDCLMFGRMLESKGVTVNYKLAQQDERRTRQQVYSVLRSAFYRPAPDGVNIIYFSGHGVAGSDDTRGALNIGCDPDVRELPLAQLRAQTRNLELLGHRGRKRTYIDALQRQHILKLDDCLSVWKELGGAARGSRLLIVADSCYSGKLISRLRGLPARELAQLNIGIQSAGNARQTVGQASDFSHGGRWFGSSGCLTAYLTAKQEEGARVRWSWPGQHPQFYCTWDPAAAERPSVELELGGGHTFWTYSQPEHR